MDADAAPLDAAALAALLERQGFAVLRAAVPAAALAELRLECDTLRELAKVPGAAWGADAARSCVFETLPPPTAAAARASRAAYAAARASRAAYAAARGAWPLRPAARDALLSGELARLALELLGPDTVLFNDQYVVKEARSGAAGEFAWHRDSAAVRASPGYRPFLSFWVSLEEAEVDEAGGCLLARPGSHERGALSGAPAAATPSGRIDAAGGGCGGSLAVPLRVSAGDLVIMADVLHASGPNGGAIARRAWMPQFASGPVRDARGALLALAVPLRGA
jgi:hypothetical protein